MKNKNEGLFSIRLRAGRRRTYFFDVRTTRSNDYFLTITESKKRFDDDGYDRHKIFLYKEDFNKFIDALQDTIDHVKTELMPEYDFDEFTHEDKKEIFGEPGTTSTQTEEGEHEAPKAEDKEVDKSAEPEEKPEEPTSSKEELEEKEDEKDKGDDEEAMKW